MTGFTAADSLHRLLKQALDSGIAASLADAEAMFLGYRLVFNIGANEASDPLHQAALLTGIALARRVFLGGVSVIGMVDTPLRVPLIRAATLSEAVVALGGSLIQGGPNAPIVTIGGPPRVRTDRFHLRTVFAGWRGGAVPAHSDLAVTSGTTIPIAAMLSVALAVNEAFRYVAGGGSATGRRSVGLSLWRPSNRDWVTSAEDGPELLYLPARLWLIGLGHLGQAYLWGLGLLPYPDPTGVSLVLQDTDAITPASESTSILSDQSMVGQKKTRVMAAWAEQRGFATVIYERLFDASFRRQSEEPAVALCGIDNALGRRALDQVGFDFVVEAGLGRGHRDFRSIRVHTLPGARPATDIWKIADEEEDVCDRSAYQKMLSDGDLDQCGITVLAGKAVGAPFVGAVAACLVISEVLRLLHDGPVHQVVDVDLQSIEHRSAVKHSDSFRNLNPGYVRVS